MLLETLDLRTNDVLIYSQNMFNFNNSFRIIYKNEKIKKAKRISYFDVCTYVKDPSPKNLVIYRLLTNVNSLDAYSTKYGYFIKINGKAELIYFDPIFAIKDLRHLRFDFDPKRFRFKIQQVGLTSLTKKETEPSFAEVYSFDLRAIEAQNQNDKIFADAIFAFDAGYNEDEMIPMKETDYSDEKKINSFFKTGKVGQRANTMYGVAPEQIAEDKGTKEQSLNPLRTPDGTKVQDLREEIIGLLKQALGIGEVAVNSKEKEEGGSTKDEVRSSNIVDKKEGQSAVSSKEKEEGGSTNDDGRSSKVEIRGTKIEEKREGRSAIGSRQSKETQAVNVFDLFKSTSKSNELSDRAKESIVLKFE